MAEVTVVMPVYNGNHYLRKSIDSVLNQTFRDFELVIVDDGSTDQSGAIADCYAGMDKRIRVIHQANSGSAYARIQGVRYARTERIAFIDADDWWEEDFLAGMFCLLKEYPYDLVAEGCCINKDNAAVSVKLNNIEDGAYIGQDEMEIIYRHMLHYKGFFLFGILPYLWNKLFRKDLLEKAFEDIDTTVNDGDDVLVLYKYISLSDSIRISSLCKYHYFLHPGSMTAEKKDNFYENASKLYLNLDKRMKTSGCYRVFKPQLDEYMRYLIWMKKPESFHTGKLTLFPFREIPAGSKVALYGAGTIGRSFYEQIVESGYCEITAWFDRNSRNIRYRECKITDPSEVSRVHYEYIVIAIEDKAAALAAGSYLMEKGVSKSKIIRGCA